MLGTIVNALAVVVGGTAGSFLVREFPDRMRKTVMHGLGLSVILIGITMASQTREMLVGIGSLVLGGIIGEIFRIEDRLNALAGRLEAVVTKRTKPSGGSASGRGDFVKGFVRGTLIYCIGALAITGALEDGLRGNQQILYAKSMLDGVSAVMFSSTMGIGVAFSALSIFVYQGAISLAALWLGRVLTPAVINEMSAAGGLLILAIGLNIMEMAEIKVGNLLPAVFVAGALVWLKPAVSYLLSP